MPEAEVAAFHLLGHPDSDQIVSVAIDGAQAQVSGKQIFPVREFLEHHCWDLEEKIGTRPWQGGYQHRETGRRLVVHSRSGVGDVVIRVGELRVRAECKGEHLAKGKGAPHAKLQSALGQLLTVEALEPEDVLVAAVPKTDRFERLAARWRVAPLVARTPIRIALVGRDGSVEGLEQLGARTP